MILRLPFGRGFLTADVRGLHCRDLVPDGPHHPPPVEELVGAALDRPLSGAALEDIARGCRRLTVLVPDATRKSNLPSILPLLFRRLDLAGVESGRVTVLVACGTHPPADSAAAAELVGPLPAGTALRQHDCRDGANLVEIGRTTSGTTIRLNRIVVESDVVVAVSSVQHHYFAGFGGGRKLVFPGVSGYEEIQANHACVIDLTVDPPRRHPGCEPGVLEGNPVAQEIAEAARLRTPDFAIVSVAGPTGEPAWVASGPMELAFSQACERVRDWYEVSGGPFNRLVVSAGGYPTDHTVIQAHKALDAACRFAQPGAEVLFVAACDGGLGSPEMEPFLADPDPAAIARMLARTYVQYGHTTLRLVEKTRRFAVLCRSRLAADQARALGLRPVEDPQGVLDRWRDEAPAEPIGVMISGAVYPRPGAPG